jgi:hypothetical protein
MEGLAHQIPTGRKNHGRLPGRKQQGSSKVNIITKDDEESLAFDPDTVHIGVSRHFKKTWMRKWGWQYVDVREALRDSYEVYHAGGTKWEVYVRKKGEKKLVITYDEENGEVYVITGAEG